MLVFGISLVLGCGNLEFFTPGTAVPRWPMLNPRPSFVSTHRANNHSRSDSRFRKIKISAFGNSPAACKSYTRRSDRRQIDRARSSAAELDDAPGVAQPLKLTFCASISCTSASSFAVSSGVTLRKATLDITRQIRRQHPHLAHYLHQAFLDPEQVLAHSGTHPWPRPAPPPAPNSIHPVSRRLPPGDGSSAPAGRRSAPSCRHHRFSSQCSSQKIRLPSQKLYHCVRVVVDTLFVLAGLVRGDGTGGAVNFW